MTCDDDLKFFMEESPCHKLIFDFGPDSEQELTRKRTFNNDEDAFNHNSKKLRKQMQQIDLSSDSSVMDTDDDETSADTSKNSSTNDVSQIVAPQVISQVYHDQPSTSKQAQKELDLLRQNVNIISVDIIKPAGTENVAIPVEASEAIDIGNIDGSFGLTETIEIRDDNGSDVQVIEVDGAAAEPKKEDDKTQQASADPKERKASSRIVISDSSDDEDDNNNNNNNNNNDANNNNPRRSDGAYASSYSFTNVNDNDGNGRYESRGSFGRGPYRQSFHQRRSYHNDSNFHEQARRRHSEHIEQAQEHARLMRENARTMRDNARHIRDNAWQAGQQARMAATTAINATATILPDIMSNFRAHFQRPMFNVADINQQLFGAFGRR